MARDGSKSNLRQTAVFAAKVWGFIGLAVLLLGLIVGLGYIWPALELIFIGTFVAFLCSPIVNFLEDKGLPRPAGAGIALIVVLAIFLGVFYILLPPFFAQALLLIQKIPGYISQLQDWLFELWSTYGESIDVVVRNNLSSIVSTAGGIVSRIAQDLGSMLSAGILPNIVGIVNNLFLVFLGLIVAYWLSVDYPTIVSELTVLAGPDRGKEVSLALGVLSRSVGGYMRGILITATTSAVLCFLGYSFIGHPYAGLMGVTVFVCNFVPVVGPYVALILAALLALIVSPVLAIWTAIIAIVSQSVVDNLLSPIVMQSAVKVHPVISLVSIVIGASLGGILGIAVAIPCSAALKCLFIYYFETKTQRQLVSPQGALFKSTPYRDESGGIVPALDAIDDTAFFETSRLVSKSEAPVVEVDPEAESSALDVATLLREHASDIEKLQRVFKGPVKAMRRSRKKKKTSAAAQKSAEQPLKSDKETHTSTDHIDTLEDR